MEYYNEEEIMSLMKDIDYGYVDKDNNKYYTITKDLRLNTFSKVQKRQ